ncbi:MAG: relaxase domain-containing protein [Verrucomicrobiales bacterium]|nr:relaxase domain-containing protein [Verrucomicrobiales bacterium]
MLSVSKAIKSAGQGEYYLSLAATDDYYLGDGGEPPGFWLGRGAEALGLRGTLAADDFRHLLQGRSPDGQQKLVHNADSANRRAGWDLTWSVPKSVSVAWSQADPLTRAQIEACLRRAVHAGVGYLESLGVVSRRGEDGVVRESARLVFAGFEHSTSRAQDPQLHVHTILINIGVRPDGSTGTLEPREIYRHQLAAGALFRAELAAQLEERLNFRARRHERSFEVVGVPPTLIEHFSKRRAEIEAALREMGLAGAKASEVAALATRVTKQARSRQDLFAEWRDAGRTYDWTAKELGWLLDAQWPERNREAEASAAGNSALTTLTDQQSTFTRRDLVQHLAQEGQGRGLGASEVLRLADLLVCEPEIVRLGGYRGEMHWTTKEVLALEQSILTNAEAMRAREQSLPHSAKLVAAAVDHHSHLSDEQRRALQFLCESRSSLRLVQGLAGTGKSTLFAVAREVWQEQGLLVQGAAPSGKAAQELQSATGIPCQTVHRLLMALRRGDQTLGERTVLVVDEAAMVGTRELAGLFEFCRSSGAALVLCGDPRQLQAVSLGGIFPELVRRHSASELNEIQRQREPWARQAVKDFAFGRADRALPAYAERGFVSEALDHRTALERLVADWKEQALHDPRQAVMLAATNADVLALNRRAQEERILAGCLGRTGLRVGQESLFPGDRVLFTRNSAPLGVCNGDLGTVSSTEGSSLTVELERGYKVTCDTRLYSHLQLGYAFTTHKAQGMTTEQSFILASGSMINQELAYVQASRASGDSHWYLADEMPTVTERMKRSRPKEAALTVAQQASELELTLVR